MISVIIPCHNHAKYLRTAVDSVLVQTRGDHEIIIVNDASEDNTHGLALEIIEENPGRQIDLWDMDENVGLSVARNTGIAKAKGEYILPLDADDFLHPMFLAMASVPLDKDEADIVSAGRINFGRVVQSVPACKVDPNLLPVLNQLGYCSIYRRECWEKTGGYPKNYPQMGYEDWEFWIKCAKYDYTFAAIPEYLWFYRLRPNSMAQAAAQNHQFLVSRIIQRHPELYAPDTVERAGGSG